MHLFIAIIADDELKVVPFVCAGRSGAKGPRGSLEWNGIRDSRCDTRAQSVLAQPAVPARRATHARHATRQTRHYGTASNPRQTSKNGTSAATVPGSSYGSLGLLGSQAVSSLARQAGKPTCARIERVSGSSGRTRSKATTFRQHRLWAWCTACAYPCSLGLRTVPPSSLSGPSPLSRGGAGGGGCSVTAPPVALV